MVGRFRWLICALLLFGATKNYMDRQVLGVLKTTLQHDLGWNEIDYSNVVFAFQSAYAVGMRAVGSLIDRLGTRLGYSLAMVFWSLASMAHAFAGSLVASLLRAQRSDSARRAFFPPASSALRNGSRRKSGHWPPAFLTPAQTSGPL